MLILLMEKKKLWPLEHNLLTVLILSRQELCQQQQLYAKVAPSMS